MKFRSSNALKAVAFARNFMPSIICENIYICLLIRGGKKKVHKIGAEEDSHYKRRIVVCNETRFRFSFLDNEQKSLLEWNLPKLQPTFTRTLSDPHQTNTAPQLLM